MPYILSTVCKDNAETENGVIRAVAAAAALCGVTNVPSDRDGGSIDGNDANANVYYEIYDSNTSNSRSNTAVIRELSGEDENFEGL
jgi:hypothetical protein